MTSNTDPSMSYEDYFRPQDGGDYRPELSVDAEVSREYISAGVDQLEAHANDPQNASLQTEVDAEGSVEAASAEMMREIEALLRIGNNLARTRGETVVTTEDITAHRNTYGLAA